MKNNWKRGDLAYHEILGMVEVFEVSNLLQVADVMPEDEVKWGTKWYCVRLKELKKPTKKHKI